MTTFTRFKPTGPIEKRLLLRDLIVIYVPSQRPK